MGKFGLVLSGGVAKGAYEVGVIKALAETGMVPDVCVGISAGALNGAMMSGMIAGGEFTPPVVKERLEETWVERVTLSHFYHAYDGDDFHQDLDKKSLNNLFLRFGIDPVNKVYLPTKLDPNALKTLENILRGNFISMFSHAYFRQLANDFNFPHTVKRGIKFSAVLSNLMGETSLDETDERIKQGWTRYEDFHWYPNMSKSDGFIQYSRLIDVIMASSSFPMAFSPMRLSIPGSSKPGLFIDGGMADNAPIGKVIGLDPDVDTILVVMATTIVPPLEEEPQNVFQVFNRMSEMLAGKFIINNYHKVMKVNRRIQALGQVLQKDEDGQYLDSEFNELMSVAAGFTNLADFRRRRVVRIVPLFPSTPLKGDLFAGFLDKKLRREYVDMGYANAMETIQKRLLAPDGPGTPDPAFPSFAG
ncbi:Patatin-like phospholipase [compost metagenome]